MLEIKVMEINVQGNLRDLEQFALSSYNKVFCYCDASHFLEILSNLPPYANEGSTYYFSYS